MVLLARNLPRQMQISRVRAARLPEFRWSPWWARGLLASLAPMVTAERVARAVELMDHFAHRTGLTSLRPRRRYLWTDAFAVCNFLGLRAATGDERHTQVALRLVDQVHRELGRHRADDPRHGWISGLPDDQGEAHPTRSGLRIGKPRPERGEDEPIDPDLEWDRDGQYFHYLTKWAHALDQVARATGRASFHVWARDLVHTAHRAFTVGPAGAKRMVWKLSIDLSRPLVPSMGQHDPLDGLVTCARLDATAADLQVASEPSLVAARLDFTEMLGRTRLATTDPLGLGGLLSDVCHLAQLDAADRDLIASLLGAAAAGLAAYAAGNEMRAPAEHRLAFRELGLAIGLGGISTLQQAGSLHRLDARVRSGVADIARFAGLGAMIEAFWLSPEHRRSLTWTEHADINDVMLATSLVPEGFLALVSPKSSGPSRI